MNPQRSMKEHLTSNLKELGTWRSLGLPIFFVIYVFANHSGNALILLTEAVKTPLVWLIWILIIFVDAIVRAVYWHARERNPTYIKKQEAYEKWKAEKEAAKQKADEQAQPKK